MNRVLAFDDERGVVTVEGGIEWPELIGYLNRVQEGRPRQWGIVQKQTGADRLSIAGALSCNAHGRGLNLKPLVSQVQAFDLVGPDGAVRRCSRTEHPDLFRLAIGGYGLFGIISRVELRLRPRVKVRRVVVLGKTTDIIDRFEERIRDGYLYGDYQYATDAGRNSFLRRGVFSCYQPVPLDTPLTEMPVTVPPETVTDTGTGLGFGAATPVAASVTAVVNADGTAATTALAESRSAPASQNMLAPAPFTQVNGNRAYLLATTGLLSLAWRPAVAQARAARIVDPGYAPFMTRNALTVDRAEPVRQNMNQPACPAGRMPPVPLTSGS